MNYRVTSRRPYRAPVNWWGVFVWLLTAIAVGVTVPFVSYFFSWLGER